MYMYIHTHIYIYIAIIRYEIMKRCWNFSPDDRPRFADLVQHINQTFTKLQELPPIESDQNSYYLKIDSFVY